MMTKIYLLDHLKKIDNGIPRLTASKVNRSQWERVVTNLGMVIKEAIKYKKANVEDLIGEGILASYDYSCRYETAKGGFYNFAIPGVRYRIREEVLSQMAPVKYSYSNRGQRIALEKATRELEQQLGKRPTTEELAAYLDIKKDKIEELRSQLEDASSPIVPHRVNIESVKGRLAADRSRLAPFEEAEKSLLWEKLQQAVDKLQNEKQKIVIKLRYGLEDGVPKTEQEVADILHLTRQRISQIELKALAILKRRLSRPNE
jgi:RNA polymerase primary sigma factor